MYDFERPKRQMDKTILEKVMNIICYGVFVIAFIYLIGHLFQMPDRVATHVNFQGEIDGWGSKWTLLIMPAIAIPTMILMEFLERNPQMHNYPSRFSIENAALFYENSRQTLNYVKNSCLILFAYIMYEITRLGLGENGELGLPIFIAILAWMTAIIIYKAVQRRGIV